MTDPLTKLTGANRHSVWRHACLRVCEATEQLGVEVGPILKDLDLVLADLMTPGFRVPLDAYQRLVMACVLGTGRFDLGFYINQNITVLGNTLIQNALVSSSSAKRAFDRYIDLAHIVDTSQNFGYETNGNASAPIIGKPDAVWPEIISNFREKLLLTGIVQMGRFLLGPNDGHLRLEFRRDEPKAPAPWYQFFGGEIIWGAAVSKVWWETAAIYRIRPSHNEGVAAANYNLAMQNQSTSPGLARRVKTLVRQKLAEGRAAQKVIASELGLEIRTLQRELKAEGTSFRKLLIDVRKELAIQLLSRGKPIGVISVELGYVDQSAFSSAFKGWFGLSPAEYRKNRGSDE